MRPGCCHTSKTDAFSLFQRLDCCLVVWRHAGICHFLDQLNIKVSVASRSGCLAKTTGRENQKQTKNDYLRMGFFNLFIFCLKIIKSKSFFLAN